MLTQHEWVSLGIPVVTMDKQFYPWLEDYGGYDYEFVEAVPDRFTCSICAKVLHDPHLTACCGQHYCESCLAWWSKTQGRRSCPHCREENFTHILNKERKREIEEIRRVKKIRCTLRQEGCQWVGELDFLHTHLISESGCGYVEVSCTNKCRVTMKRKDLNHHLMQECPLREYKCEHCGQEDTHQAITGVGLSGGWQCHYDNCPKFPLDCPKACGASIPRKDMSDHRAKCPLEPVECPFKEAGCPTELVRKDYDAHMTTNMQQHLVQMMTAFQPLQAKCAEYEQRLAAAEQLQIQSQIIKAGMSVYISHIMKDCSEEQKLPLQCMQALLDDPQQLHLKKNGNCLTITMLEFSQYKQSGKVWHSPPFYYKRGYKMCLVVFANGTGAGAGTHVSVSLLLLRGEFDDRLTWPLDGWGEHLRIELVAQREEESEENGGPEPSAKISLCSECTTAASLRCVPDGEDGRVLGSVDEFADHENVWEYDSIVLRVVLGQHVCL